MSVGLTHYLLGLQRAGILPVFLGLGADGFQVIRPLFKRPIAVFWQTFYFRAFFAGFAVRIQCIVVVVEIVVGERKLLRFEFPD